MSARVEEELPTQSASGDRKSSWQRTAFALLSAALPGLGQWISGRRRTALWQCGLFIVLVLVLTVGRAPSVWVLDGLIELLWLVLAYYSSFQLLLAKPRARVHWFLALPLFVAVLFVLRIEGTAVTLAAGFRRFSMPSSSMEPTIEQNKDSLLVDLRYYRRHKLERGEVVVYLRDGTYFCKRVVALPGDTVQVRNGVLLVNGGSPVEPYAIPVTQPNEASPELFNYGPQKIGPGQIFVMGDNRPISLDSRTLGPLPATDVKGRVLYLVDSKAIRKPLK